MPTMPKVFSSLSAAAIAFTALCAQAQVPQLSIPGKAPAPAMPAASQAPAKASPEPAAPAVTAQPKPKARKAAKKASAPEQAAPGRRVVVPAAPFAMRFDGDLADALTELHEKVPALLVLAPSGQVTPARVKLDLPAAGVVDVLRSLGEQAGDVANVIYSATAGTVRLVYKAPRVKPAEEAPPRDPIAEVKRWQAGQTARPVTGPDGVLLYPYGQVQPTLTCAPLRACVVQMEPGEVIRSLNLGDTARWLTAPATSGNGATAVQQIIVKPTPDAAETNMVVSTDRRTYFLTLKRSETDYLSRIGWYYPTDMVQQWNGEAILAQRKAEADEQRRVADLPITSIDQLNLDGYRVKGDRDLPWFPVRVFDDGAHVWIQMPASMRSSEAPALVLLDDQGGSELVNYRVKQATQGGQPVLYYIVDKLFDRAGLIVGVDSDQKKVEIVKQAQRSARAAW